MKSAITFDYAEKKIILGAAFNKKASREGTPEFVKLKKLIRDFEGYEIEVREIKKPTHKESYRGLNYQLMEEYITIHDNADEIMAEYKDIRFKREGHSNRFPYVKQWFLKQYPEFNTSNIIDREELNEIEAIAELDAA